MKLDELLFQRTNKHNMSLPPFSENKNLVVVAGARPQYFEVVLANVQNHFSEKWDCLVYLYEDDIPQEFLNPLEEVCFVHLLPNREWGDYLYLISPPFSDKYNHIAIMLDDVYMPATGKRRVDIPEMLYRMERHEISVLGPAIAGAHRLTNQPSSEECMYEVNDIEVFMSIYSKAAWRCAWSFMEYWNHSGWCLDICYASLCPAFKQAIDHTMVAYHLPGQKPEKDTTEYDTSSIKRLGGRTLHDIVGLTDATPTYNGEKTLCELNKCKMEKPQMEKLYCGNNVAADKPVKVRAKDRGITDIT
ncbi:hypothetical protein SARC_04823 [Sphaeroforma arctica JP610]|uniref:Uncharacterized protein n=1 Tax=Sphaeroforma arctica JP610 TaxID=667725 RepID=A0A0L0G3V8_9EUKA|nr:hypothetical protein SARC_04823 [Sphaeroforma arctica JP610]KNC82903.1 hypothetical protein SARC_04823 [Sphaeroforma arctica JP610]|eukprot:XP_014156805.1 hypothetical protein SARC_04823 [Sphaeroforma arctica JP610]